MSASAVGALTRASWYQARSYRLSLFMQVAGILLTVVPIYFIAHALQTTMVGAIARESEQYFSFVLAVCWGVRDGSDDRCLGRPHGRVTSRRYDARRSWVLTGYHRTGLLTFTAPLHAHCGWACRELLAQIGPADRP
jgi:hypothetical protein